MEPIFRMCVCVCCVCLAQAQHYSYMLCAYRTHRVYLDAFGYSPTKTVYNSMKPMRHTHTRPSMCVWQWENHMFFPAMISFITADDTRHVTRLWVLAGVRCELKYWSTQTHMKLHSHQRPRNVNRNMTGINFHSLAPHPHTVHGTL